MVWKATRKRVECGRTVVVVGEGGLERGVAVAVPLLVVAAPSAAGGCMTFFMVVAAVDLVARVAE